MKYFNKMHRTTLAAGIVCIALSAPLMAQDTIEDRVVDMSSQVTALMDALQARAEGYPPFIEDLRSGLISIENADQEVETMITELRTATDKMEDGAPLDELIDEYAATTSALIAEAEASNNAAIKGEIPSLQESLQSLKDSDQERARTVIEARNLIRSLEQNREALAFFLKSNRAKSAAKLIAANVEDFNQIIANGKTLAEGLISAANP